jgi:diguanylate cyclase (GGDEF)-like protein/PAS domain S-box-containing protein
LARRHLQIQTTRSIYKGQHSDRCGRTLVSTVDSLLREHPNALVSALGVDARPVPVPASVPLCGQQLYQGRSGLELVAARDQLAAIDAWQQSQTDPVVRLDVHLGFAPDQLVTIYLVDARAEHGVHLLLSVADDPELVFAAAAAHEVTTRPVAHVSKDAVSVILDADEATTLLLGWQRDDLVGHRTVEFVHPDDVQRAIDSWMEMRSGLGSGRLRVRYRHAHGHYVWVEVTNQNHLDDPDISCIVSEMVDISVEMAQLEALRDRERLLGRLAEALPIGVCHLRLDREVVYSNEPLVALLGPVDSVEALLGSVAAVDRQAVEFALDQALRGYTSDLEVSVINDRWQRRCELTFRTMTGDNGSLDGVIMCAADVTDRSRLRSELEHRASHDALSGCLNRAATVAALDWALRDVGGIAVAYIDLDQFKSTNDAFGHAAGDELLRVAAARIRSAARADDQIGRVGGDEFVVICRLRDGVVEAETLVDRLTSAINGDVDFTNQRIPLRASVGAATAIPGELDAEAVLTRADAAMYETKRRARAQLSDAHAVN